MARRTVLLTGAAGRIGSAFREDCGERYRFRLADRATMLPMTGAAEPDELIVMDVANLADCEAACQGIDTVVHLAADASPAADFYESLLDNNIKGTYNIFQAAHNQGVRRVICASSVQAVEGYPLDEQVNATMPVRPKNMYGVSKCFAEATGACFAYGHGLSVIMVRIGTYNEPLVGRTPSARNLSTHVSRRDLSHLLQQCIEAPAIQFAIMHGVSDNRFKRLDLATTRTLVGYEPQDDAFQLAGIALHDA